MSIKEFTESDLPEKQFPNELDEQYQANKTLNDKLLLIFAAIENARNGIIITDHQAPDEPIIYCNKAFLELTGYTEQEVLGQNCRLLQGHDCDQEAIFQLREALRNGTAAHVQIRNYRKDGTMFWNDLLMSPIIDEHGTITHFSGNQLDITRRKEAEESLYREKEYLEQRVSERTAELQETKEYLEGIVETVRQPLVVLDERMYVISANQFFYKTFRVEPAQTEGKLLYELGNRQWAIPRLRELLEKVLPEQNPFEGFEVEHEFPEIGKRTMVLNARQLELQRSGQARILLAIEDISQRKGAEVVSQQSQALTQAMMNSLNAHIAVLDQQGVIIEVNEAWKEFARAQSDGTQETAFIGQNYLEVLKNARGERSEEAPLAYEGIKNVMEKRLPHFSLEYPCFTPDAQLWFLLQVTPLKQDGGGVVVAHIDITDRKQAEIRKDDFISMASHELKTPITSMQLNVQTLEKYFQRKDDMIAVKGLAKVHMQIKKLTRLVNELLDVSRIYAGKLEVKRTRFDIDALIRTVIEDIMGGRTEHSFAFSTGGVNIVVGDSDRVEQVLINLFTNAIKYSPPHSTITVNVEKKGEHAVVSVHDNGIGIPREHQAHVFERFYQVTEPVEKTYPGLGMGLYISHQIICQHGGTIWVESQKGQGATFFFTLPLDKEQMMEKGS